MEMPQATALRTSPERAFSKMKWERTCLDVDYCKQNIKIRYGTSDLMRACETVINVT